MAKLRLLFIYLLEKKFFLAVLHGMWDLTSPTSPNQGLNPRPL